MGTEEDLCRFLKRVPITSPVEYLDVGRDQYICRTGGWKIWIPLAEITFPAMAVQIWKWDSDGAQVAARFSEWLSKLQKYLEDMPYPFNLTLETETRIAVHFVD